MTDLLWMPATDGTDPNPNYIGRFRAEVAKARRDWVLLDRTAFYAEGGGQPADTGVLRWDGGEARVVDVSKRGVVKHVVEGELPDAGVEVAGRVDWDRRYRLMRAHTAQHVASAEAHRRWGTRTLGAEMAPGVGTALVDEELAPGRLDDLRAALEDVVAADRPVRVSQEARDALEDRIDGDRVALDRVPSSVRRLRVVEVEGVDVCPCAGTHVASTGELGPIADVDLEAAGDDRWRLRLTLGSRDPPDPAERKP